MKNIVNRLLLAVNMVASVTAIAQQPPPGTLPVKQVTLFTSGVAYTERGGTVDGDAVVPLTFRTAQINDILKSMVLLDRGGKVQPATYGSRDPIGRSLQAFAVDVTSNTTRDAVLGSLRGAKVSVAAAGKPTIEGQIVGVEQKQIAGADGKPVNAAYIDLLTDTGIMSVALDADKTVNLLDERLNHEFHDALALLATGTDDQRRSVILHFAGNGKRDVRVGYVLEAPIWKISYRLLLGGNGSNSKPYLQGWALVENTTDEDRKDVNLSLVSGRPISFIQDLYQPLYIHRPVVGPDVVASPYPQTHDEAIVPENRPTRVAGGQDHVTLLGDLPLIGSLNKSNISTYADVLTNENRPPAGFAYGRTLSLSDGVLAKQSVDAQAEGEKAGELFQYSISTPVSLPRQQAVMIPVIAQDIETEALDRASALYNRYVSELDQQESKIETLRQEAIKLRADAAAAALELKAFVDGIAEKGSGTITDP